MIAAAGTLYFAIVLGLSTNLAPYVIALPTHYDLYSHVNHKRGGYVHRFREPRTPPLPPDQH